MRLILHKTILNIRQCCACRRQLRSGGLRNNSCWRLHVRLAARSFCQPSLNCQSSRILFSTFSIPDLSPDSTKNSHEYYSLANISDEGRIEVSNTATQTQNALLSYETLSNDVLQFFPNAEEKIDTIFEEVCHWRSNFRVPTKNKVDKILSSDLTKFWNSLQKTGKFCCGQFLRAVVSRKQRMCDQKSV